MNRWFCFFGAVILLLVLFTTTFADEGMWPLYDLDKIDFDKLHQRGLMLSREDIYNPEDGGLSKAVVRLGATGSFVSADGLIVTNHHVAFGAVQRASTVKENYITDGFYAPTRADEIPAIGYNAYVTLGISDVTDRVKAVLNDDMTYIERHDAIEAAIKEIIAESEKGRDVNCSVSSMFGGEKYVLYTFLKIQDIRIVYVPPDMIGEYGGDIDNWEWPRHVGDFSFLRAYVAPDGSPAEYSEDNVPYHPEKFLTISSQGVKDGDFTMMMGFPGRTNRYIAVSEMQHLVAHYYPLSIKTLDHLLAIVTEFRSKDSTYAIRLASTDSWMNNSLKKSYGLMEGFRRSDIVNTKAEIEKGLTAFINSDPELTRKYGRVVARYDSLNVEIDKHFTHDYILGWLVRSGDLLGAATGLHKWSLERQKEDMDRDREFQDRDLPSFKRGQKRLQINLLPEVDKAMMKYIIMTALQLPANQRIACIDSVFAGVPAGGIEQAVEQWLDKIVDNTKLKDLDFRLGLINMSTTDIIALNDPLLNFAVAMRPELDARKARDEEISGLEDELEPKLAAAYRAWKKDEMSPDANGTMRFNYGEVTGYTPRDGIRYFYLSGVNGVMEKETGVEPFIVPEGLKATYVKGKKSKYFDPVINDVPVNFLTNNDGTGGNSGSPVFNGKGELIGLDFDSDYEGVSADYLYEPELARSIVVDIRYVLYIIDEVYHLDNLLNELTIH